MNERERDFGGIVRRTPREVVRPASAGEVAALLRHDPSALPRGCGHSTDGRSLTSGIMLDMRGLATVHEVRDDRVSVDAGATWREVLEATLPYGLTPPVLTDYLDLTVGGTLAAGGVGGTSHVHGLQTRSALDIDVAASTGEVLRRSPAQEPYGAVRGGLGGHGVITRATLRLVPAPRHVLSCKVACRSAAELLRLQARTDVDHLSGQARPSENGWRYELKAVLYEGEAPPPGLPVPAGIERLPYLDFADRMRPDVAELIALGEWERPHPWAMAFLPGGPGAAAFIERTLAAMGPSDLGLSGVVLIKALTDRVLFGLLRTASPGCAPAEAMTAANRTFHAQARALGGTPYPDAP
ncbi:FAD-binding protein [Actinomadura sp. 9N407]|uniref:FAD-binding protein n=1 Tax=Actinomadura sp. 9N407 TaxID=3375154 RepID=UPI0037B1E239